MLISSCFLFRKGLAGPDSPDNEDAYPIGESPRYKRVLPFIQIDNSPYFFAPNEKCLDIKSCNHRLDDDYPSMLGSRGGLHPSPPPGGVKYNQLIRNFSVFLDLQKIN